MGRGDSRIARILREARTGQGLSQRELGERSGLTQAQISLIENSEVDLRLSSLIALVDVLGIDLILTPRPPAPAPASTQEEKPETRSKAP
ncbi:MAG: helix-turn-helix transcriptional regulator [bacterium]|nr:helix-turn-helix transcriptional regulator [bacterium]MDE0501498.1 helix-turn-helix transcriptional regulator [bacterium]